MKENDSREEIWKEKEDKATTILHRKRVLERSSFFFFIDNGAYTLQCDWYRTVIFLKRRGAKA